MSTHGLMAPGSALDHPSIPCFASISPLLQGGLTSLMSLPSHPRWPYKFKAVYTVALHGEQLQTELRVHNTDTKPFEFTAALHSYFEVLSVEKAKVTGLKGEETRPLFPMAWEAPEPTFLHTFRKA